MVILHMNLVKNCVIMLNDIQLAQKIFGLDVATIKGKTTCVAPMTVKFDTIHIPCKLCMAQSNLELCIDTMFVNSMVFLAMISKRICYRTATWIQFREMSSYRSVLDRLFKFYQNAGFQIKRVYSDNKCK